MFKCHVLEAPGLEPRACGKNIEKFNETMYELGLISISAIPVPILVFTELFALGFGACTQICRQ